MPSQRLGEGAEGKANIDPLTERRGVIACNGLRHRWHLWHAEQRRICKLQSCRGGSGFESHPHRQKRICAHFCQGMFYIRLFQAKSVTHVSGTFCYHVSGRTINNLAEISNFGGQWALTRPRQIEQPLSNRSAEVTSAQNMASRYGRNTRMTRSICANVVSAFRSGLRF